MKSKFIGSLVGLVVTFSLLVGCGSNTEVQNTSNTEITEEEHHHEYVHRELEGAEKVKVCDDLANQIYNIRHSSCVIRIQKDASGKEENNEYIIYNKDGDSYYANYDFSIQEVICNNFASKLSNKINAVDANGENLEESDGYLLAQGKDNDIYSKIYNLLLAAKDKDTIKISNYTVDENGNDIEPENGYIEYRIQASGEDIKCMWSNLGDSAVADELLNEIIADRDINDVSLEIVIYSNGNWQNLAIAELEEEGDEEYIIMTTSEPLEVSDWTLDKEVWQKDFSNMTDVEVNKAWNNLLESIGLFTTSEEENVNEQSDSETSEDNSTETTNEVTE